MPFVERTVELFKFSENQRILEGDLIGIRMVRINGRPVRVLTIQKGSGRLFRVLSTTELDDLVSRADVGRRIMITYTGEEQVNGGMMRHFKVAIEEQEPQEARRLPEAAPDGLGISDEDIPF